MNLLQKNFAGVRNALLGAALLCSQAGAQQFALTAQRACDAAWVLPSAQPRLLRLASDEAALAVDGVTIAWVGNQRIRPVTQADPHAEDARVETGADGALAIDGSLTLDAACTIDLRGTLLPVSATDEQRTRLSAERNAWRAASRAENAEARGDTRAAADAAADAASHLQGLDAGPVHLRLLARAIDALLNDGRSAAARSMSEKVPSRQLPESHPAALQLGLARARLLAFANALKDSRSERERMAPLLDATFGVTSTEALNNRVLLANSYVELGDFAAAEQTLDAIAVAVAALPAADPLRQRAARSRFTLYARQGRSADARRVLEGARIAAIRAFGAEDPRVLAWDESQQQLHERAGEFEAAAVVASRIYLARLHALGPNHARTLRSATALGSLYFRNGRLELAQALLEDVVDKSSANQHNASLTLRARHLLGAVLAESGAWPAAVTQLEMAADGYRNAGGDKAPDALNAQADLGAALLRAGQAQRACALLRSAYNGISTHRPDDVMLRERTAWSLGRCLLATSAGDETQLHEAQGLLHDAWRTLSRVAGADSADALRALSALAAVELRRGERATAKKHLLEFVAASERQRARAAVGSLARDSLFSTWAGDDDAAAGYRTLAALHAQDNEIDAALRISELARDRRLRDAIAGGERPRHLLSRDAASLRALDAEIQAHDEALALATQISERVRIEAQRQLALQRRAQLLDALVPQRPPLVSPRVASIQAALPARTTLIAFQRGAGQWWMLIVPDRGAATVRPLPLQRDLDLVAGVWTQRARGVPARLWPLRDGGFATSLRRPPAAAADYLSIEAIEHRLGAALLAPALDAAPRTRRFLIVAEDALLGVPFEALPVANQAAVARFEFSYAPSITTLLQVRERGKGVWQRDLLALGGIDYEATRWPSTGPFAGLRWPNLPQTATEVRAVASSFPSHRVRALIGDQAAPEKLHALSAAGELAQYRYVHLAAHGWASSEHAERSSIVLARDEPASTTDGYLTATEIAGLKMSAELVTLSACDTAVGRFEQGQGLLGLAYGLLAAGNRAALLSLWPVPDAPTARFMARFYQRLAAGKTPAAALASTKREFRRSADPLERDGRNWAAFVLFGL